MYSRPDTHFFGRCHKLGDCQRFHVKKDIPSNNINVRLTVLAYVKLSDRDVYNGEAGVNTAFSSVKSQTIFGEASIPVPSAIPIF
jgi:hypothetical protein